MKRISLNGEWQLTFFPEDTIEVSSLEELKDIKGETIPAQVPGNVELNLVREGFLPDPFFGTNIFQLRAFDHYQWWYRTQFTMPPCLPGEMCRLVFHGLDCLATVWLNGARLGDTDNMLIPHAFDVTALLRENMPNDLAVQIRSAVNAARKFIYEPSVTAFPTNFEHLHIRKAPHSYGWDIAPRAVSAGIWRSVELEVHPATALVDVAYATLAADENHAALVVNWQFKTDAAQLDAFSLRFRGVCDDSVFEHEERASFIAGVSHINVHNPKLWWPKGYGDAALYTVTCELLKEGGVVDSRTDVIGIRTVTLERSEVTTAAEPGQFLFRINGEPIFCKGSNWVPLDAFHSRDAERYASALALCDDLGCNMLRCWGGNVYEDHAFFAYCDRSGIMVWQDFAFACALYPQDERFLRLVRHEAETIVRTLRNHPSLVLWSGDNEIDLAYLQVGRDPAQNAITRRVLPEVCAACDPHRPYLPSSPYVSPEAFRRGVRDQDILPEQHLWGPRDYYKGAYYMQHHAHFASEMGYHGCPNVSSIRRFIDAEKLWPWQDNEQWQAHTTDPLPEGGPFGYRTKLMADQIREMFGFAPDNLDDFALASQISQAEAKKFFIESFRIRKWARTGILWWNLLDCWPQFSDAIVDYYMTKKLAYWYIKRAQTPVCVMVDEPDAWHCRVVASNDTRTPAAGMYRIVDGATDAVLLAGNFETAANANQTLGHIRVSRGEQRLFLITWNCQGREQGNHYLLGTPPFSFRQYRDFLNRIAAMPEPFDADAVAR